MNLKKRNFFGCIIKGVQVADLKQVKSISNIKLSKTFIWYFVPILSRYRYHYCLYKGFNFKPQK